jgi:hypothetical protein
LLLFAALPAQARRGESAARHAKKGDANVDPAHWFATREGLLRVYQAHASDKSATDEASGTPAAGASCEVIESSPKDGDTEARTKESCTMISGRMPKGGTLLTYELRASGIFLVETKSEKAAEPVKMEHLLLPSPMHKGTSWNEKHGALTVTRTVKSAGKACTAADRKFGDCLVLAVVEHEGKKTKRKYSEVYAAGVGRVEDAQWELIDVKGL